MLLVPFLLFVEAPAALARRLHRGVRRLAGRRGPAPWPPWVYRALALTVEFGLFVLLLALTGS